MSSLEINVGCRNTPTSNGPTLYKDSNRGGEAEVFTNHDADLRNNRIGNDTVSSLVLPAGTRVALYEHINYGGRCQDFVNSTDSLVGTYIGNDSVSSIQVGRSCAIHQSDLNQAWCTGQPDAKDLGSNDPRDPGYVVDVYSQEYPGDGARFYFNSEDVNGSFLGQKILTLEPDRIPGIWRYGLSSRWTLAHKNWQDDWLWRIEFPCPK